MPTSQEYEKGYSAAVVSVKSAFLASGYLIKWVIDHIKTQKMGKTFVLKLTRRFRVV